MRVLCEAEKLKYEAYRHSLTPFSLEVGNVPQVLSSEKNTVVESNVISSGCLKLNSLRVDRLFFLFRRFLLVVLLFFLNKTCYSSESIGFYYNSVDSVRELINYQRIVVNPRSVTDRQIDTLHSADTQVFAYLSIGEYPMKHLPGPIKSAALIENDSWKSHAMNLANDDWQQYLTGLAKEYIERDFDGLFLDTLDSYRLFSNDTSFVREQQVALISLINRFSRLGLNAKILVNRGFDILDKLDKPVDAVVAESLYFGYEPIEKQYYKTSKNDSIWLDKKLEPIKAGGTEVIVIDYVPSSNRQKQLTVAKKIFKKGFTPYVSDGQLKKLGTSVIVPIAKRILGFYDGNLISRTKSGCHQLLSMPVEYLGYVPECMDVNQFDFSLIDITKYAAVILWLNDEQYSSMPKLQAWINITINEMPFLFLGGLPTDVSILEKLGIKRLSHLTGKINIVKGSDWFNGATPRFSPFEFHAGWKTVNPSAKSLIDIADQDNFRSSLLINGPWGGALLSSTLIENIGSNIDPFKLIDSTLKLLLIPSANITTESGRRVITAHIDGDGFPSKASFPGQPYVSEVILENLLKKYNLPHTVSVIEGEIGARGLHFDQSEQMEEIARKIFKLPNIEAASHTFSHPFFWDLSSVKGEELHGKHLPIEGYELDYHNEIVNSSKYINQNLLPKNKKVKVLLWSGDAAPKEQVVKIAEDAGLLNVNGGNTYALNKSTYLKSVSPAIVWHPTGVQVYAPVLNENVYTIYGKNILMAMPEQ